jgi:hypothetical protein
MDIYDLIKVLTEKSIEHGSVISISTKNIFNVLIFLLGLFSISYFKSDKLSLKCIKE